MRTHEVELRSPEDYVEIVKGKLICTATVLLPVFSM